MVSVNSAESSGSVMAESIPHLQSSNIHSNQNQLTTNQIQSNPTHTTSEIQSNSNNNSTQPIQSPNQINPQTEELLTNPRLIASPLESELMFARNQSNTSTQSHASTIVLNQSSTTNNSFLSTNDTINNTTLSAPNSINSNASSTNVVQTSNNNNPSSSSSSSSIQPTSLSAALAHLSVNNNQVNSAFASPANNQTESMKLSNQLNSTESSSNTVPSSNSTQSAISTNSITRPSPRKCIIGICAMDKKANSTPMRAILDRLKGDGSEFQIIIFGDSLILNESINVTQWPIVDCLISFSSRGFPLSKCIDYVKLRKPFCINDIPSQRQLLSRPAVYESLVAHGLPTPKHLYVHRAIRSNMIQAVQQVYQVQKQQQLQSNHHHNNNNNNNQINNNNNKTFNSNPNQSPGPTTNNLNGSGIATPRTNIISNSKQTNNQLQSNSQHMTTSVSNPNVSNLSNQETTLDSHQSNKSIGTSSLRGQSIPRSINTTSEATNQPNLNDQASNVTSNVTSPTNQNNHQTIQTTNSSLNGTESIRSNSFPRTSTTNTIIPQPTTDLAAESMFASSVALAASAIVATSNLNNINSTSSTSLITSQQSNPSSSHTSAAAQNAIQSSAMLQALQTPSNCLVEDFDDYIQINGQRMNKPLLEKPFDGDDHSISIYYPKTQGGGVRHLFRKIANVSSRFESIAPPLRSLQSSHINDSYVYEELLSNGQDLKVYTLGPGRAHGEMRKSPVVDGIVERDINDKELRLQTELNESEQAIASQICRIFKQNICGFDIIRHRGQSYVIDVNGWSFVKGDNRYYSLCARILRTLCLGCRQGKLALGIQAFHEKHPAKNQNRLPPQIDLSDAAEIALAAAVQASATASRLDAARDKQMNEKKQKRKTDSERAKQALADSDVAVKAVKQGNITQSAVIETITRSRRQSESSAIANATSTAILTKAISQSPPVQAAPAVSMVANQQPIAEAKTEKVIAQPIITQSVVPSSSLHISTNSSNPSTNVTEPVSPAKIQLAIETQPASSTINQETIKPIVNQSIVESTNKEFKPIETAIQSQSAIQQSPDIASEKVASPSVTHDDIDNEVDGDQPVSPLAAAETVASAARYVASSAKEADLDDGNQNQIHTEQNQAQPTTIDPTKSSKSSITTNNNPNATAK